MLMHNYLDHRFPWGVAEPSSELPSTCQKMELKFEQLDEQTSYNKLSGNLEHILTKHNFEDGNSA